jgi:hypothetical protein
MLLASASALVLATAFAACGGDDSSPEPTPSTAQETTTAPSSDDGGTKGEASAAFRTPGGDNSIQNYGEEADGEELEAATVVLADFMTARANDDWAAACTYLAEAATKPLEELAARSSKLKGEGCPGILAALVEGAPASARDNTLTDGIASLRVEGDRGFALYHGPKGVDYFVPMTKEDGEWKVGTLAPTEFS